ncbi:hypothetical protein AXF42_Ash001124 [Apostasia shenzhenica]|uniref:Uncharacterized protein n=1 Tax=Apostasia shenzhenica TaxID=1088818 RepID=A0A2I0AU13_9ASPA|nr:hypothetical protein AXF42_Ash001123 [Apostasia shenzhenica]PKA59031.1 hypothetical protein AXF42_Ash001124 [Apostasia shenzhenica]
MSFMQKWMHSFSVNLLDLTHLALADVQFINLATLIPLSLMMMMLMMMRMMSLHRNRLFFKEK